MTINDIINKKENNISLTKEEIEYTVNNYVLGNINDEDMTLFLKAVKKIGMTEEETLNLTVCMLNSGDIIDLSNIKKIKVDKHSTGGVGDKTTLIVAPIVASCGVPVIKMSGEELGFTGGTIDKLISIKGFNTDLTEEQFLKQAEDINLVIASHTRNLVPADKKIYALRDLTDTVDSIPLIASSIMSKKLASGSDKIVLDVKVGSGAFMKDINRARELAYEMVKIGKGYKKETIAILSNMNQPLGNNVGNSLEVEEAIETLEGRGSSDLTKFCIELSSYMVSLGKEISIDMAQKLVEEKFYDKSALNKFKEWILYQGGDLSSLPKAKYVVEVTSDKSGYINAINTENLGMASQMLGAGRIHKGDIIDYSVGLVLNRKIGDYINKGEILLYIYTNKDDNEKEIELIKKSYVIGEKEDINTQMILDIIR